MERRRPCIRNLVLIGMLLACVLGVRETTALEVGEKAPDFTLPSTMGEKISLSQFQGKQFVLIEFYGRHSAVPQIYLSNYGMSVESPLERR